jgi:hypothetical protein
MTPFNGLGMNLGNLSRPSSARTGLNWKNTISVVSYRCNVILLLGFPA